MINPLLSLLAAALLAAQPNETPYTFEAASGETVAAWRGTFEVPAHHDEPDGPRLELVYVRFPATTDQPGAPIVYLAGGPGGSGIDTARGRRCPLFMALREVADVIAFDQRGTGQSSPAPGCRGDEAYGTDRPLLRDDLLAYARQVALECQAQWQQAGVDLSVYNTWDSAGDLDVLRQALDADKISLWGISYGTHLALAALKRMGDRVDRAVLASAEGLDQTVKLPARADGYFKRLAEVVAAQPAAAAAYPDLVGSLRRAARQLDAEPATVGFMAPDGTPLSLTFDSTPLRYFLSFAGKNPDGAVRIPPLAAALEQGHYQALAPIAYGIAAQPMGFSAMSLAMDVASGISPDRLAQVNEQAKTAIVGDGMNFPMPHFVGLLDIPDLGEAFRSPVTSDVPTLFLTGTLDGRTFPEAHAEIIRGFANAHHLEIENAGHDLFMVDPAVTAAIVDFMQGRTPPTRLRIDPPDFAPAE